MSYQKKVFIRTLLSYLVYIGIGLCICFVISLIWHPFLVSGTSMSPTYHSGNILLCDRADSVNLKRGDIVVFKTKGKRYLKRIVALPGDSISIIDGVIYVNNSVLSDFGVFERITDAGMAEDSILLQDDEYFCLGDNRNNSYDSRHLGPINKNKIKYIVKKKLF